MRPGTRAFWVPSHGKREDWKPTHGSWHADTYRGLNTKADARCTTAINDYRKRPAVRNRISELLAAEEWATLIMTQTTENLKQLQQFIQLYAQRGIDRIIAATN